MTSHSRADLKHTRTAGGVVINVRSGKVLVVSQNGDSWSLPKGHLEQGEDDLTAAKREITEESGVTTLTFVRPLGEYQRFRIGRGGSGDDADEMKTLVMFLFTTGQAALAPKDPQNPEARWVDRNDVARMLTHKKDAEFFTKLLPELPA
jgi:ADP-ribose pyrophosphatase YjhB (NUDIX family)